MTYHHHTMAAIAQPHNATPFIVLFISINQVIQQNGLLQPARVISILPREDVAYFLMGMAYLFYFILINNVIQQNGLLQPTRVISILPSFIYFILY
jgi:hypothetical protein